MKKKIKLLGLMTVLALSFSCAQSNADNTPGPPASVSDVGIVVYVFGDKRTNGARLVQGSDPVVQAEEGKELVFLVTTNIVGPPISVMYDVTTGSGVNDAVKSRVCTAGSDFEDVMEGGTTTMKGATFPIKTFICPDDTIEGDEKFKVKLRSGDSRVTNSPFNIEVIIPNDDKALVSVRNIRALEAVDDGNGGKMANSTKFELTLENVGMVIEGGLIINYEIQGVEGANNSVEAADFAGGVFPSGEIEFEDPISVGAPAADLKMESDEITFIMDNDSINEEFKIALSLGSEKHKDAVGFVKNEARGFILHMDDMSSTTFGCEPFSTGPDRTPHPNAIQISTLEQLQDIDRNQFTRGQHYILMNDIDASDTETWNGGAGFEPIGDHITRCGAWDSRENPDSGIDTPEKCKAQGGIWFSDGSYCLIHYRSTARFDGSFDGNNHTISNLHINRPRKAFIGLFGAMKGKVCRLRLVNVNITGWGEVGGIAGWGALDREWTVIPKMTKTTCTNANMMAKGRSWWWPYNPGDPNSAGECRAEDSLISDSLVTGRVTALSWRAGGLVGIHDRGTIARSYSAADVEGRKLVGGLIGSQPNTGAIVRDSYSSGNVLGAGYVGGLIGKMAGGMLVGIYTSSEVIDNAALEIPGYGLVLCTSNNAGCTIGMTPPSGPVTSHGWYAGGKGTRLTVTATLGSWWNASIWGRREDTTKFPCIKGLPIYTNAAPASPEPELCE